MNPDQGFWAFSLRVYARPAVPAACLALQDAHGLDVNLLLYCCWLGTRGTGLDSAALAAAMEFTGPWTERVVRPLRDARTWMKRDNDARARLAPDVYTKLRESIKAVELEAERLEQLALEGMAAEPAQEPPAPEAAASCATENVLGYLRLAGVALDADVADRLATIVGAATGIEAAQLTDRLHAAHMQSADG